MTTQKILNICNDASLWNPVSVNYLIQKTCLPKDIILKNLQDLLDRKQIKVLIPQMWQLLRKGQKMENLDSAIFYVEEST